MGVIFIEGLPCAGKTTMIKELEKNGESVCYELGDLFNQEDFPGNGQTLEEIEKIDNWFINKEEWRMSDLSKRFFDRSYFTHLSYAYAYSNWISLPSFKLTVNRYRERVLNSNLVLPECVIYIDISSQTSIDRQLNNIRANRTVGLPHFWQNKYFLDDIILSYEKLWECLINIPVYKIDGKLSVRQKLLHLKNWLKTKKKLKSKTKYKKIDLDKYIKLMENELIC